MKIIDLGWPWRVDTGINKRTTVCQPVGGFSHGRGGVDPVPSFVASITHDFFKDDKNTWVISLRFQILEKWAILHLSLLRRKTNNVLASGGFAPLSWPEALLLDPAAWGHCPETPVIGSRYPTRHWTVPPRYYGLEPPLANRAVLWLNGKP